jgi:predicted  nucleic acid-binding Zn-ribbon protein
MGAAALSVRCLGCGSVYRARVSEGAGTLSEGCPRCGYVGWVPIEQSFSGEPEPTRSAADRPQRPPEPPR